MSWIYELNDVAQQYQERVVLQIDQLQIQQGELLALIGPSGAGKSSLLRLLAFLERPTTGNILYKGKSVTEQWPILEERRKVGMVFQRPALLRRSVYENVAYGLQLRQIGAAEIESRVMDSLKRLGLERLSAVAANKISGGEMQRVALARALVLQPDVLLLDEPTANLDPANVRIIERYLRELQQSGITAVLVTHHIFQAQRLADRVALLWDGRLLEVGENESFFKRPQKTETAAFLNGEIVY